ncbi:ABC transporter permease [Romboutsia ilealis]|uniref:ABC transporter permease n=1 Tax=Romboutsia faecis TaxID=2764597 RepID=A0ABR7JQB0_9FIRM|nr:ABC transporter permease [Romboutsia faecis]MBC5997105.1 ABC transporter permease [Romboutsia faecis]MRN23387.1 ABC transporter permease [Romboutsia ilealis]
MNFFKRAILSIKSRLSKTLLLFTVITTICLLVLSGISIQTASKAAGVLARQQLGAEVTLKVDTQKMRESMIKSKESSPSGTPNGEPPSVERMKPTMTPISTEYIDELLKSEYIEGYLAQSSTSLLASNFTAVGSSDNEDSTTEESNSKVPQFGQGGKIGNIGDVTLTGVSNLEQTSSFKKNNISMVEGEAITDKTTSNVAIIEEALASENDLSVGDTITVGSTSDEDTTYDLKIIGIYTSNEDFTEQAMMNTAVSPYNNIYTNLETISNIKGSDYENAVDSAIFYLNDPTNVDSFIADAKENSSIDFDTFTLDANDAAYEQMLGPIENISSFSKIAVYVISIAGGLILTLIIMLSIRDRNQEIGILLSLGEKKPKIIAQFAVEILLILVLSLGASSLLGNSTSNIVANQLLSSEISSSENSNEVNAAEMPGGDRGSNKGFGGMFSKPNSDVDVIDELDVSVSSNDFFKMAVLGTTISLIATCVPAVTVMRLNPKNILSKHS